MKRKYLILGIIIFLAVILRFWQLGNVPPSPDWDEAALGYNAYSIMQTGRDEYGKFLPIILRSFDDYKPALYSYLAIPFIKLLGLNVVAVRLPSAILGVLTVLATYFLVKILFHLRGVPSFDSAQDKSATSEVFRREGIALLSAFLLAVSPWHLQFSRVAFEANVGLAFNVFAALFFLKSFKKPWLLILSAIFAGLSLHVYQGEKVFLPLFLAALITIFRKEFFALPRKYLLSALLVGFSIALPLVFYIATQNQALLRARGVSFFSDQTPFLARTVEKLTKDQETKDKLGLFLDNRRMTYALAAASGYLSHFDLNWLFISGDEARHHAPNMGLLYLFELPFLLVGIYKLIYGPFDKKTKWLIFSWFFLAPVPASITSGVPHAIRTLNFLPTFQIFTAVGVIFTLKKISDLQILSYLRYLLLSLIFSFFIFNFFYYLNQYFVQQNYFNSADWQYGYQEAIEEVKKIENGYEKIIVTNKPHLDQSYMFFLFFLKYDPSLYQKEGGTVSGGFAQEHKGFAKYTFRPIEWDKEEKNAKILYVGRPEDFPEGVKTVKIINFLNGKQAIKIIEE